MAQDLSVARAFLDHARQGTPEALLDSDAMTLASDGALRVAYAPFDHVAPEARLVIVGITPGRVQAVNALRAAGTALRRGADLSEALAEAKRTGSFSGPLRANLVAMLDAIGASRHLGVESAADLFAPGSGAVHFTSALRYPVFVNGANYNGTPDVLRTPILRGMIETHLAEEARLLPDALWLPLGPKPEAALRHLAGQGVLDLGRILGGMPHPSGANAERVAIFLGRKDPGLASRQTDPVKLLAAYQALSAQIGALAGARA